MTTSHAPGLDPARLPLGVIMQKITAAELLANGTAYVAAKYLPATNTRGARFRVTTGGGRYIATVPFNYAAADNAAAAVDTVTLTALNSGGEIRSMFIRGGVQFFRVTVDGAGA